MGIVFCHFLYFLNYVIITLRILSKQEKEINNNMSNDITNEITQISTMEKSIEQQLTELEQQNPDVFKQIKAIEQAQAQVQKLKEAVKAKLVEDKDFDLHEVGNLRVSVSAVAKVKVKNIDEVSDDFKEVKTVANENKAKEYLKVMKKVPAGFEDASFYRLNWRITDEN